MKPGGTARSYGQARIGAAVLAVLLLSAFARADVTEALAPGEIKERRVYQQVTDVTVAADHPEVVQVWVRGGDTVLLRGIAPGTATVTITAKVVRYQTGIPDRQPGARVNAVPLRDDQPAQETLCVAVTADKVGLAKKAGAKPPALGAPATQPAPPATQPVAPAPPDPTNQPGGNAAGGGDRPARPAAGGDNGGADNGGAASDSAAGEGYHGEEDVTLRLGEVRSAQFHKQVKDVEVASSDTSIVTTRYSDDTGVTLKAVGPGKAVVTVKATAIRYNAGIPDAQPGPGRHIDAVDLETDIPLSLVYRVEVRPSLAGIWIADGYELPGGPVRVRLTHDGDEVTAYKVTGNAYVGAGKITWHGRYLESPFTAQGVDAKEDYEAARWRPVQVDVADMDHLTVTWKPGFIVSYVREGKQNLFSTPGSGGGGGANNPGGKAGNPNTPGRPNGGGPAPGGGGGTPATAPATAPASDSTQDKSTTQPATQPDTPATQPENPPPPATTQPDPIGALTLIVRLDTQAPAPTLPSLTTLNRPQRFGVDLWAPRDRADALGPMLTLTFTVRDQTATAALQRQDTPAGVCYSAPAAFCLDGAAAANSAMTRSAPALNLNPGDLSALGARGGDTVTIRGAGLSTSFQVADDWPAATLQVEWRDGLVMGLQLILVAFGKDRNLANAIPWEKAAPGATFYNLDAVRLTLRTGNRPLPANAPVQWYQQRDPNGSWQALGPLTTARAGQQVTYRLPAEPGPIAFRGEVQLPDRTLRTDPVAFSIEASKMQAFQQKVLVDIADGVYQYRQAQRTTKTYKASWQEQGLNPLTATIPMLTDPATGRPYNLVDGDVVLRTGGPMGYTQRALGAPRAPQNHSGVLKIENYGGQRVCVVHGIGWGYEQEPLTPRDAALFQQMTGAAKLPGSFLGEANTGTVEVYRPIGVIEGTFRNTPYDIGKVAAARAVQVGATAQHAYDALFLESSHAADSPRFKNLFYCHEFTRECFGRGLAQPVPIPRLQEFWKAAFEADAEAVANRAAGKSAARSQQFIRLLNQLPLDAITFSDDPAEDQRQRTQYQQLIQSLSQVFAGGGLRALMMQEFQGQAREAILGSGPDAADQSISQAFGIAKDYAPLVGVYWVPELQSWIAGNDWITTHLADYLVDETITDLGNALDAQAILEGGTATGANGEQVKTTFKRINQ